MTKKKVMTIIMVFLILVLCAATIVLWVVSHPNPKEPDSRTQIIAYVQTLFPEQEFGVSEEGRSIPMEFGESSLAWDVYLEALPEVTFQVRSIKSSTAGASEAESVYMDGYSLSNNFGYAIAGYFLTEYEKENQLLYISQGTESNRFREQANNSKLEAGFVCSFTDTSDLEAAVDEFLRVQNAFDQKMDDMGFTVDVYAEVFCRKLPQDRSGTESVKVGEWPFAQLQARDEAAIRALVQADYICYLATYNQAKDLFSYEEIVAALEGKDDKLKVTIEGEEEKQYPDLRENGYKTISVATAYEILVRSNIKVRGDEDSYSFIGTDGNRYSFASDLKGYLCNGEPGEEVFASSAGIDIYFLYDITGILVGTY